MVDPLDDAGQPEDSGASPTPEGEPAGPEAEPPSPGAALEDPAGLRAVTELRKPSTLGGIIYLAVLVAALVGVGVAASGAWRTGVSWLSLSLLVAAGARLALDDDDAGMLRVRRKVLDATTLVVMGVALLVLAATIPDQPS